MPKSIRRFIRANGSLLLSIGMIAIAVTGGWWGLVPFGRNVWTLYTNTQKLRTQVGVLENKYAVLSSLDQASLAQDGDELLRAIPAEKEVATLLSTLEQTTITSGLSLSHLTIVSPGSLATGAAERQTKEEKAIGAGIISSTISVEGPLPEVKQFLSTLQRIRRLLRVGDVQISVREGASARAQLTIDAFYQPLPTALGDITSKIVPFSAAQEDLLVQLRSFPVAYQTQRENGPAFFAPKQNPFTP
ncbi:hypothetical protein A2971_05375 [Candidatus Gottesmanbacteria bacterium RIFCSPLOWO2_01_FULL_46_21]|uniref:Uncharacterized protein n=1 Tax=Candidatus Gottesmanbacteria bacterium RIFCSPLOWO2_01_FULL_46_21 TaxID=1798393 RepID=A0A1F6B017_9BACT|nr:MAG: hypothetical protein A2971_05375 [Candidatus Gottesmanbacteria bacterium RIFCSPLOWO2_01_FULL_46_21]